MSAANLATITKMLETLPDLARERAIEHLREYLEDLADELRRDEQFARFQDKLAAAALGSLPSGALSSGQAGKFC